MKGVRFDTESHSNPQNITLSNRAGMRFPSAVAEVNRTKMTHHHLPIVKTVKYIVCYDHFLPQKIYNYDWHTNRFEKDSVLQTTAKIF
jgi:hypothetical protein